MNARGTHGKFLLNCVLILILIIVTRVQEIFTFLVPLRIGMVVSLFSAVIFLFSSKPSDDVILLRIPQVKFIISIYLLCIFSVPFSFYPRISFEFTILTLPIVFFFIFLLLYSVESHDDLQKVVWTYILGVLLLCIFATISSLVAGVERASASSTYDTNDIAAIVVVTLPLIYFFMGRVNAAQKMFLFGAMIFLIFTLILTGSRGGFLGLIAIMVLLIITDSRRNLAMKLIVIGTFFVVFIQLAPDSYWERMGTITSEQDYNRTLSGGRIALWKEGVHLMLQNPITGVGVRAIDTAMGVSSGAWKTAHNSFIQIGTELGVGGLVLFIALLLSSIFGVRRFRLQHCHAEDQASEYVWLAAALEVSLWGYCVVGFFLSWAYSSILFFLIALCGILKKIEILSVRKF